MLRPAGYARLKTSLAIWAIMVCSVLLYQYNAYRPKGAVTVVDSKTQAVYAHVQVFPQTLPILTSAAYQLSVVDMGGNNHVLGSFLVPNQDQITNTDGSSRPDSSFTLPAGVTGLRSARIDLVARSSNQAPFDVEFVQGNFKGDRAFVEFDGMNVSAVSGSYQLGTPTDGNDSVNERSGVWFGNYQQNTGFLRLPPVKSGWVYEGWAMVNGHPLTTGRFTSANGRDAFSGFSDQQASTPSVPGEDFLRDPPVAVFPGLTFPTDLAGTTIRVTLEPDVDGFDPTGQGPFGFVLLSGQAPNRAEPHVAYTLTSSTDALPKATIVLRP